MGDTRPGPANGAWEGLDPQDTELLADLTRALEETDAVPPNLVQAAKDSWTWRTIDAELAALVGDTADEPVLTRAAEDAPRLLTFSAGATSLILEVVSMGAVRRVLGQIVRPRRAEVEVRHSGGSSTVQADDMGRFRLDAVPGGPLSVVCRFLDESSRPLATSWVAV